MLQIRPLFSFFIFLNVFLLDGQNIRFDHLDINNGLSQNSAFCMDMDKNGYLWVGTLNGLNRYNGYSFEVFKPSLNKKGSLHGSLCVDLCADNQGNTWVVTRDGGLNKYDASRQEFVYYPDSLFKQLSSKYINSIQADNNNHIWLKANKGVLCFNPQDSTAAYLLQQHKIQDITLLPNGNIAAYGSFGIFEILQNNDGTYTTVHRIHEAVNGIAFSNKNTVVLHPDRIAFYTDLQSPSDQHFLFADIKNHIPIKVNPAIYVDSTKIWIGGNDGLIQYEHTDNHIICHRHQYNAANPHSFRGYIVTKILKDSGGNLWIGTAKHGINFISKRNNAFKHFNWQQNHVTDQEIDLIRAICVSSQHEYWVGFDRRDLGIIHPDGRQTLITDYEDENGEKHPLRNVRAIFEDQTKNIWVAMLHGICIYNRKKNKLEHINRYFKSPWNYRSYFIKQYSNDQVLVTSGSKVGILSLKNETEQILTQTIYHSIWSNIRDAELDGDNIWLGLDNQGIARLNIQNKQLKTFHPDSIGLSNAKVYSITKNGNDLWIGTNNGLNRFNLSSFKVEEIFYEEHGLSNNIVYSLNVDHEGHLWMSTNRGLSKLNTKTRQFSTFLKSDFFMDDASFQAQDGHIYYGGYNGIVHFDPQNIQSSDKSLTPVIENFKLNNKIIKQNETVNNRILFKQAIHHISSLKLSHEENTFTFEFNAIPYDLPNTNQFRYKLENWQNNWQTGSNRSVTFTNVSPGNYRMLLSVCNAENIWSSPKEINIQITPPYWQELWFKLLLIGIITILLVTLYRWRLFRIRQRNILLKRKVKEQTQDILKKSNEIQVISQRLHEADEAKLRFFTNISHEFRTPLTLILGYLEEIEDAGSIQIRKSIKNNALRLLRLVNQLIEFRKLDQDQLKLNITHLEINAFIEDIVISFQKLAEQKNIDLRFEPTPNRLFVWLDMDKTEKIFFNLISNAIKYTPENNPVLISIHENTDTFSIEVADYGIGINEDELTLVFNRFFRSKNSGESGHGIGLALAKGLVDMQHGHIDVQSKIHQGSIFTVQFKKGKDHFKPDDFNQHQQSTLSPEQKTNSPQTMPRVNKSLPTISDKQILLVEDDMELKIYLKKILSDQYAVISANNGQDALDKLEEILPDLIISDISMPVLDGLSFCKKIKENEITSGIPFILLTAKTDSSTRIGSYQLGIDDYIEKPFSKNVLLARVEALLSNREKLQKKPVATRTTASIDKTKLKKRDIQFWKKTNTLINKNYNNPDFTTEILSKKMNMSRSTFYRRFKHISGENAGDYIRKVRLHKAAELLQKKEFSIQQISIEVGFQSTAHFRTKFKEYFGTNPSEYN